MPRSISSTTHRAASSAIARSTRVRSSTSSLRSAAAAATGAAAEPLDPSNGPRVARSASRPLTVTTDLGKRLSNGRYVHRGAGEKRGRNPVPLKQAHAGGGATLGPLSAEGEAAQGARDAASLQRRRRGGGRGALCSASWPNERSESGQPAKPSRVHHPGDGDGDHQRHPWHPKPPRSPLNYNGMLVCAPRPAGAAANASATRRRVSAGVMISSTTPMSMARCKPPRPCSCSSASSAIT